MLHSNIINYEKEILALATAWIGKYNTKQGAKLLKHVVNQMELMFKKNLSKEIRHCLINFKFQITNISY